MNVTATPPSVYGSVRAEVNALCHGLRCDSQTTGSAHATASTTGTVSQQHQQPRSRRASSSSRWPARPLSVSARRALSESWFSVIAGEARLAQRATPTAPRQRLGGDSGHAADECPYDTRGQTEAKDIASPPRQPLIHPRTGSPHPSAEGAAASSPSSATGGGTRSVMSSRSRAALSSMPQASSAARAPSRSKPISTSPRTAASRAEATLGLGLGLG